MYQENIYRPGDEFVSFKKVMCDLKLDCQLVSFHSTSKGYWGECGRRGGYLEMVNFPDDVRAELYKLLSILLSLVMPLMNCLRRRRTVFWTL